ncbi:MAG TPA: enoyl-ACP reductase [Candidatus Acidoferrum sp.]|nr:enoyl-ACP reductase [Candidatus Acidoferrum sp.]
MTLLADTTGLVMGVANKRSIAWGIAQALSAAGMRLAFTYQGERLKENVEELAATLPGSLTLPCDVTSDAEVAAVFESLGREFGRLHTLVHSLAYAPKEALEGEFVTTSRADYRMAQDISAYSLVEVTRAALPLLQASGAGSVIAMTYYGSEKVTGNYNVMGVAKAALEASVRYLAANLGPRGVRVNAISAGAVNTLAGRGVRGFTGMLNHYAEHAPLRRNVELREIGDTAVFLASRMSSAITGEVLFVDCGYNIMGV